MDIEQLGFFLFMEEQEEKQKQLNINNRSIDLNCLGETDEPHQNEKDI